MLNYSVAELRMSNVAWTISGATGWCTPEVTSGSGSRTVALTIADNDTRNPRSATLTVASSQGKYACEPEFL